jgi:putative flippase GtrA
MRFRPDALARFALGGVVSSSVVLGVSALLAETHVVGERVAPAIGLATSLAVNFLVLRHFVFRSTERPVARQGLEFLASSGAFRAFEYAGFLAVDSLLHVHYLIALVLVLGTSFGLKFLWYESHVFKREPD